MEVTRKTAILFSPEMHRRFTDLAARRGQSLGIAAVVLEERMEGVFSFDADFDRIHGVVCRVPEG